MDYVIIYARSRAFRNYIDAGNTKMALAKLGVKLVSAKEDFGDGLMAEAMEAVTDVFNWLQVRMSGEDIKVKMANKARNGGTIGRAKVGYLNVRKRIEGREVRTIETDPERAPFVVMAFELFATGKYTARELATDAHRGGTTDAGNGQAPGRADLASPPWPTCSGTATTWDMSSTRASSIRVGTRRSITPELFERVQKVLDSHSGAGYAGRARTTTTSRACLWCARCEHRFIVQRAAGNGGEYFYFFCRGRQEGVCDQPYLNVHAVEQAVLDHYATVSFSEEFKAAVRAGSMRPSLTTWGARRTSETGWRRGCGTRHQGETTCSTWPLTATYRRRRSGKS